jgi:hypothetical protein
VSRHLKIFFNILDIPGSIGYLSGMVKTKKPRADVFVRLDLETYRKVQNAAKADNRTVSAWIRLQLAGMLAKGGKA